MHQARGQSKGRDFLFPLPLRLKTTSCPPSLRCPPSIPPFQCSCLPLFYELQLSVILVNPVCRQEGMVSKDHCAQQHFSVFKEKQATMMTIVYVSYCILTPKTSFFYFFFRSCFSSFSFFFHLFFRSLLPLPKFPFFLLPHFSYKHNRSSISSFSHLTFLLFSSVPLLLSDFPPLSFAPLSLFFVIPSHTYTAMIFTQLLPLAAILASSLTTFTHAANPDDPPTIHHQQQPPKGKAFDHILIIFLENTVSVFFFSDNAPMATPNYLKMLHANSHPHFFFRRPPPPLSHPFLFI